MCQSVYSQSTRQKDVLIGATALVHDMVLVTDNTKIFQDIDNLQLFNLFYR